MALLPLWAQIALYALVGALVGSFLNVVADRLPARGSLVRPGSHCPGCGRALKWWEMAPIVSYLALGGKCRQCGARIPLRVWLVELIAALLFAFLFWRYGPTPKLLIYTVYSCILLTITVIDLEHKLILNVVIWPAIVLALLLIPVRRLVGDVPFAHVSLVAALMPEGIKLTVGQLAALSQLAGGLAAFLVFFIVWIISPQGMGDGDVRLSLFIGLITGFPGALVAVFSSFVLGGVISILLLVSGLANRKTAIPFAPFLVVTTFAVMLYGDALLHWYLGL